MEDISKCFLCHQVIRNLAHYELNNRHYCASCGERRLSKNPLYAEMQEANNKN